MVSVQFEPHLTMLPGHHHHHHHPQNSWSCAPPNPFCYPQPQSTTTQYNQDLSGQYHHHHHHLQHHLSTATVTSPYGIGNENLAYGNQQHSPWPGLYPTASATSTRNIDWAPPFATTNTPNQLPAGSTSSHLPQGGINTISNHHHHHHLPLHQQTHHHEDVKPLSPSSQQIPTQASVTAVPSHHHHHQAAMGMLSTRPMGVPHRSDTSGGGGLVSTSAGPTSSRQQQQLSPSKSETSEYSEWLKSENQQETKKWKTRTKEKYRVVYTDRQRLELEKEFHFNRYITLNRKAEISKSLDLTERQVKIWFQNRRAKERKDNKRRMEKDMTSPSSTKSGPEDEKNSPNSPQTEAHSAHAQAYRLKTELAYDHVIAGQQQTTYSEMDSIPHSNNRTGHTQLMRDRTKDNLGLPIKTEYHLQ